MITIKKKRKFLENAEDITPAQVSMARRIQQGIFETGEGLISAEEQKDIISEREKSKSKLIKQGLTEKEASKQAVQEENIGMQQQEEKNLMIREAEFKKREAEFKKREAEFKKQSRIAELRKQLGVKPLESQVGLLSQQGTSFPQPELSKQKIITKGGTEGIEVNIGKEKYAINPSAIIEAGDKINIGVVPVGLSLQGAANVYAAIKQSFHLKESIQVSMARETMANGRALVKDDITKVRNGEKDPADALADLQMYKANFDNFQGAVHSWGKASVRNWVDKGKSLENDIAIEQEVLEGLENELNLAVQTAQSKRMALEAELMALERGV